MLDEESLVIHAACAAVRSHPVINELLRERQRYRPELAHIKLANKKNRSNPASWKMVGKRKVMKLHTSSLCVRMIWGLSVHSRCLLIINTAVYLCFLAFLLRLSAV